MSGLIYRSMLEPMLPWDNDPQESSRFRKLSLGFLIAALLLSIVFALIEVPKPDRTKRVSIPPRLMKMVLEQKKVVKPPPPPELPKEEPKEEPKPEEKKVEERKPEPKKPSAKEVAKKHIAVFDALADLRELDDVPELKNSNTGLSNNTGKAATVTRSIISKKATQGSGGIKVATASRSTGVGTLKGQNETKVESDIEQAVANTKRKLKSGQLKRSSENIQLAFEQAKPSIFSIYHRALRKNPSLQGKVVFRLTIEPDGRVSSCTVVSSELNDPALERRIISRIKRIRFGALQVARWTGNYPINFLPSS